MWFLVSASGISTTVAIAAPTRFLDITVSNTMPSPYLTAYAKSFLSGSGYNLLFPSSILEPSVFIPK